MKREWPSHEVVPAGTPHPNRSIPFDGSQIRYHKGHDVVRPHLKYSTSKWECSYIDLYEVLLDPLKHEEVSILELGVYQGESLRYFRDFFTNPDTVIVGVDKDTAVYGGIEAGELHNVILEDGDQRDTGCMGNIADQHGPFDVIIDDASHDPLITENCFRELWKHLKDGGIYLIEDIGPELIVHLLDEIVLARQGKGFAGHNYGCGYAAGHGGVLVLKKTQNLITGLEI